MFKNNFERSGGGNCTLISLWPWPITITMSFYLSTYTGCLMGSRALLASWACVPKRAHGLSGTWALGLMASWALGLALSENTLTLSGTRAHGLMGTRAHGH
jgi:hypothetical protein